MAIPGAFAGPAEPVELGVAPGPALAGGPTSAPLSPKEPSLGVVATRGMVWLSGQIIIAKGLALAGQVALAWLLKERDFGAVALAYTATAFPVLITQVGIAEVLIQRVKRFDRWAPSATWLALTFGLLAAVVTAAVSWPAVRWFHAPEIRGLIFWIAAAQPLLALAIVPTAALQRQLRFRTISALGLFWAGGTLTLSVILAALGAGPYSFVVPLSIVGAVRLGILYVLVRPPMSRRIRARRWKFLLGGGLLLLLATVFHTLITMGDYLTLGLVQTPEVVGIYYFGFNLSMQAVILFASGLQGVLFPALSKIREDPERQLQGFRRAVRMLAAIGVPACLLQAGLADAGVHAVFSAKWYPSIPVIQVLSVGMALRLVAFPARSLLQARGRFGLFAMLTGIEAVLFLSLVATAAHVGRHGLDVWGHALHPATVVAIAATLYFAIEGPATLFVAQMPGAGSLRTVIAVVAPPLLAGSACVALGMAVASLLPSATPAVHWIRIAIIAAVAILGYSAVMRATSRDVWDELNHRLRALLPRRA